MPSQELFCSVPSNRQPGASSSRRVGEVHDRPGNRTRTSLVDRDLASALLSRMVSYFVAANQIRVTFKTLPYLSVVE